MQVGSDKPAEMMYNFYRKPDDRRDSVFLTRFFSSEGMDLFPDMYLFKGPHFLYILFCALAFIVLMKVLPGRGPKVRRIVVLVSTILMLVLKYGGEVIFVSEYYASAEPVSANTHSFFDWRTLISFQICGINNILLPLVVWFDWKKAKDFVYGSSILGGLAVILYPVGVLFGDPIVLTFPLIRTLLVHFLLFFLPCYLIREKTFKFEIRHWPRVLVGTLLAMAWAMYGNLFVDPDANNMYMMQNPFYGGPIPLLNAIPDGWHLIFILAMIALGFLVIYALSGAFRRRRRLDIPA
ncbi:MAG TPA: hypothetical protein DCR44_02760 [Acholeplasmatales bacterium]|nr:hypothetical protein [Acholeplasmatales bacterium]